MRGFFTGLSPQLFSYLVLALALVSPATGAGPGNEGSEGELSPLPPFVEQARELGLDFTHFNGMSGELYFVENMGAGAALFDYDGDGDLDAYLVQGAMLGDRPLTAATFPPAAAALPLSDRLYRNDLLATETGGTEPRFVDVTRASGLAAAKGYGMGVAVGDIDGDGNEDLYLTSFGPNQMWRNRGDGTFEDITEASGTQDLRWSVPAVFFDLDGDRDLDLYAGNYVGFRLETHSPCLTNGGRPEYCGPLAYPPETDRLWRNRGDGTFENISKLSTLGSRPGNALGAISGDFDGDGLPDLYVANDGMPNHLWLNRGGGRLAEEALFAGLAVNAAGDPEASMGVGLGDVDADGDEDLFITHLAQETNTLYLAEGGGLFADATLASALGAASFPYTAFGTVFLDHDGDGWLDLLAVNGAVKQIEAQVQAGEPYPLHQPNQLFRNRGGGRFDEVSSAAGEAFATSEVSRGAALGDVEGDGDPDVLISNNAGAARLLINQSQLAAGTGAVPSWLGVVIRAPAGSPGLGIDTLGEVRTPEGRRLVRRARRDGSYASSSDPRLLFGLGPTGASARPESPSRQVEVLLSFADGARWRLRGLHPGAYVVVTPSTRTVAAGDSGDSGGR